MARLKLPFVDPRAGKWPTWLYRGKVAHDAAYAKASDWFPARCGKRNLHNEWRKWRLGPYGCYHEHAGSIVIYDRQYCPITRIFPWRQVPEIVDPEERIRFHSQSLFHPGHWESPEPEYQEKILGVVAKYSLLHELKMRWEFSEEGACIGATGWNAQAWRVARGKLAAKVA